MGNITLSMPNDVHKKMKQHSEIKWSEVARKAIIQKIEQMEAIEKITSKSKLSEKDAKEIAEKINSEVAKKLGLKSGQMINT